MIYPLACVHLRGSLDLSVPSIQSSQVQISTIPSTVLELTWLILMGRHLSVEFVNNW